MQSNAIDDARPRYDRRTAMRRRIEEDLNRTIRLSAEIQKEARDLLRVVQETDESYFDPEIFTHKTEKLVARLQARDSDVGIWMSVLRAVLPWWRTIWFWGRRVERNRPDDGQDEN